MLKRIFYLFILLTIFSCEDEYIAKLNHSEDLLVIEAKVTNEPGQNIITISKTRNFYDENPAANVRGAEVILVDGQGHEFVAQETPGGEYWLDYSAVVGEMYQLKIDVEGEQYESDFEVMPELPVIDSFRLKTDTTESYRYSSLGEPIFSDLVGNRGLINLPINEGLSHYLFKTKFILQYVIQLPAMFGPPPPPIYTWLTTNQSKSSFKIAGPPRFGDNLFIEDYPLSFTSNKVDPYVSVATIEGEVLMAGWIMFVDQFGTSEKTFKLYETLNAQLEAEGKLFDPVFPQIQSNIKCVSDPEKTVVGFFELSSHRRYFLSATYSDDAFFYEIDDYHFIPASGQLQQPSPPYFWEYVGKPGTNY